MTAKEATDLVTFLSRHGALETGPGSALDYLLTVYKDTLGNDAGSGLHFDRVLFVGSPDLTDLLSAELGEFEPGVSCRSIDSALLAELRSTDLTVTEDALATRQQLEAFAEWTGGLVVGAALTIDPIALRNLNRVCLHHRVTWIHVAADGPFLIIGPTFVPRRSACYECLESRVFLSMRESESYTRYKAALANRAVRTGEAYLKRPFRGVLASLAALEIANLLATGSGFTIGKALTVYLPTLEFSFNEVLRVPGCAACSPMTEQREQALYFDLKGYVNSIYAQGNGSGKRLQPAVPPRVDSEIRTHEAV